MKNNICLFLSMLITFLFLNGCKSQNTNSVEIVFYDLNDFEKSDTLLITNIDSVQKIKMLFSKKSEVDAKFPRRMQISFIGSSGSEVYFSNGRYVRKDRKVYLLPDSQEYILFQSLLVGR